MAIQRPRLLVIDDDPQMLSLLTMLLRKRYFVSTALDGEAGYNYAVANRPDAVILDVQMPKWDGFRTLQAFREHPKLNSVPVVILTACAERETVVSLISAGANSYLLKTQLDIESLTEKLEEVLPVSR